LADSVGNCDTYVDRDAETDTDAKAVSDSISSPKSGVDLISDALPLVGCRTAN
jgi:hypothetical protein